MNAYIALKSLLLLLALWGFVFYLWRDYRLDAFRDDLFALRDRMFQYAANGNIAFDNPAYLLLRNRMNILLRYAHEFTFTALVVAGFAMRRQATITNAMLVEWQKSVEQLGDPAVRARMNEFNVLVAATVFRHVLLRSFFRYIVVRPLLQLTGNPVEEIVKSQQRIVLTVETLESKALDTEQRAPEFAAAHV